MVILDSLVYEYCFFGCGGGEGEKTYLFLNKCIKEEGGINEFLSIPTPITLTEEWYRDLRNNNRRLNVNLISE